MEKRVFFALVSVLSCLLPPILIFPRTTLKCSRSSAMRCNDGMRRSSSSSFDCKRQRKPIVQSVQLRKPGEKRRPRLRKRPRGRGLWRRRRERREQGSTSSDTRMRCYRKRPSYWRGLKDPRSQGPSARRSPQEMSRSNGPSRRLEGSNWGSTVGVLQSR